MVPAATQAKSAKLRIFRRFLGAERSHTFTTDVPQLMCLITFTYKQENCDLKGIMPWNVTIFYWSSHWTWNFLNTSLCWYDAILINHVKVYSMNWYTFFVTSFLSSEKCLGRGTLKKWAWKKNNSVFVEKEGQQVSSKFKCNTRVSILELMRPLTLDLISENVPVMNQLFQWALFFQSSSRFSFAIRLPPPKTKIRHNKDEQYNLSFKKKKLDTFCLFSSLFICLSLDLVIPYLFELF